MSEETQKVIVTENIDRAKVLFDQSYTDAVKFYTKGTASAAARARAAWSELSKLQKVLRKEIQVAKKQKVAEKRAIKALKKQQLHQ